MPHDPLPENFSGVWIHFNFDGSCRATIYANGKPNGPFRRYLPTGIVLREGGYQDGLFHGDLTTRNADGEVLDVSRFEEGNGIYRIFYSSGVLARELPLRAGKKHGIAKHWSGTGQLRSLEHYQDGCLLWLEFVGPDGPTSAREGVTNIQPAQPMPVDQIRIDIVPAGVLLPVHAKPRASRNEVIGIHAGRLKVAVTAAPEKGKANAAVLDVLAKSLDLKRSQLTLVAGETDPRKSVLVTSLEADELQRRIATALG